MNRKLCVLCASVAVFVVFVSRADAQARWHRGNTHTHTINSDGDSSPDAVVRWYKEHGYHFVVITDHTYRDRGVLTPVEGLNALFALPGRFLVLSGVEVTDNFEGAPVHMNGLGVREAVLARGGASIVEILSRNAAAVREAGGIAQVNHPNYYWTLSGEHLAGAAGATHFELWNGHPGVNNRGGGGKPSTEEMWDAVLSTGRVLYGMATDDSHHFKPECTPQEVCPGRAWVMVRANELTREALLDALERGDFYATTGVELKSYTADANGIRVELPEGDRRNPTRYRAYFIGKGGAVLKQDDSLTPSYAFAGGELYVRARIEASNGAVAWTQPVFVKEARK
jgi:hypothetical protein